MRLHEIMEAPISGIETIGDFEQARSIQHGSDRRAVTAPPMIKRLTTAWENTAQNWNLLFVNLPGAEQHVSSGRVNDQWIDKNLPDIRKYVKADAINIVYTNNIGDERVSLTPWIIAHRASHALATTAADGRNSLSTVRSLDRAFGMVIRHLTGSEISTGNLNRDAKLGLELLNMIGTMKSARDKSIIRPGEFTHEMFAQYLLNGDVKFNPLTGHALILTKNYYSQATGRHTIRSGGSDGLKKANSYLDAFRLSMIEKYEHILPTLVGGVFII